MRDTSKVSIRRDRETARNRIELCLLGETSTQLCETICSYFTRSTSGNLVKLQWLVFYAVVNQLTLLYLRIRNLNLCKTNFSLDNVRTDTIIALPSLSKINGILRESISCIIICCFDSRNLNFEVKKKITLTQRSTPNGSNYRTRGTFLTPFHRVSRSN